MSAIHLAALSQPRSVRCNRAGGPSKKGGQVAVRSTALPDAVTCKDCRRLMLLDRNR